MKKIIMIGVSLNLLLVSQSSYALFDFLYKEDFNFKCNLEINHYTSEVIKTEKTSKTITIEAKETTESIALARVKKRLEGTRFTNDRSETCTVVESKLIKKIVPKSEPTHLVGSQFPIGYWDPEFEFSVKLDCENKDFKKKSNLQIDTEVCRAAKQCGKNVKTIGQKKRYKNILADACMGVHPAESDDANEIGVFDGDRDSKNVESESSPESSKASATEQ